MDDQKLLQARRRLRVDSQEELFGSIRAHALGALVVAFAGLVLLFAPRPLALPILSLAMIGASALAAFAAWALRANHDRGAVTLWDAAGAFAFVGCASAMLSKPESILRLFADAGAP
jgi:hypothetical protein